MTNSDYQPGEAAETMRQKPSLLLIAHTYVVHEHAKKLPELARHFNLTCVTVGPKDYGTNYGIEGDRFGGWTTHDSYELIVLPALGRVSSVTKFTLRGLTKIIRSKPWDFVLVENEPWSLLKWQTLLAAQVFGRVGFCGEFTWENLIRPGLKGALLSIFYRATGWCSDFVIAGNQAAAEIVKGYGMNADRVRVCPQVGVDVEHYCPLDDEAKVSLRKRWALPSDAFMVGFAGRFVPEKGISDVASAIESLPPGQLGGKGGVHFALIGHGPLKEDLLKRGAGGDWLHVRDAVPHHELPSFLQCLDVLVLGSHPVLQNGTCWTEQFGHILIEAAACGALAVGSTSGAIPEVLDDADLTFPPGDVTAIRNLIERFRSDSDFYQKKKSRQRARLMSHYTHAAVADRCAQILLSLPHGKSKALRAEVAHCLP